MAQANEVAAVAPIREIDVFCPVHSLSFSVHATSRIVCAHNGHELDHAFPHGAFWQYCCDCQTFAHCEIAKERRADELCPSCARQFVRRFICDRCNTIACESDLGTRAKTFSFDAKGNPPPTCPGCAALTAGVNETHECLDFGLTFLTNRKTCPFCKEGLELVPNFPSSVAAYIEKVRQPLVKLAFDPASNVLRESNSGDYILIQKLPGATLPIVIPAVTKLSSKQDYYNTYFELFNCDNPAPGEVVVLSPAIVEKIENGWQLREAGFIDITPDPAVQPAISVSQVKIPCAVCGEPGEVGNAYCKRCGSPQLGQQSVATVPEQIIFGQGPTYPVDAPVDQFTENLPGATQLEFSAPPKSTSAAMPLKVLLLGVAVLVLVGLVVAISALSGSGLLPGSELSVEKKLDRSIASGHLFGPANDNAHDLYYSLKNSGANEETLRRYREKITPLLTPHGYQLVSGLMQIGYDEPDFTEWQDASKGLDWAEELNPGNSYIAARAAYCKGRAAYLQKDLDQALKWWTSASVLDKAWVLPVNGLGMVHTANRNWATARSFFVQASQRDANWPFPDENIGNTYWEQKAYPAAKEFYQKAIGKAPNWAKPHVHLAYIAIAERDYATAVSEFETALDPNAIGLKGKEPALAQKALDSARQKLSEQSGY